MMAFSLVLTVLLSAHESATHADFVDPATVKLARAIATFEQLKDEEATVLLGSLLAQQPPTPIAAKAHIYLALIALNRNDPDQVRREIKTALHLNPAVELPPHASPKAELSFLQARAEWSQELQRMSLEPAPSPQPSPLRLAAPAPEAAVTLTPAPRWHVATWVLLGVGVACAVTAIVGGLQVTNYNSMVADANSHAGRYTMTQLTSGQSSANFWSEAWLPFAIGGAVAAGTGVVVW